MGMMMHRNHLIALAVASALSACSEKQADVATKWSPEDAVVLVDNMPACIDPGEVVRFAGHLSRKEYSAAWNAKPAEPFCADDADATNRQRWTVLYVKAPLVAIGITKAVDYEQHSSLNDKRYKRTYFTHEDWLERVPDKKQDNL